MTSIEKTDLNRGGSFRVNVDGKQWRCECGSASFYGSSVVECWRCGDLLVIPHEDRTRQDLDLTDADWNAITAARQQLVGSAIVVVWHIKHAVCFRPDLSAAQAWEVLSKAEELYDRQCGNNLSVLNRVAQGVFRVPSYEFDKASYKISVGYREAQEALNDRCKTLSVPSPDNVVAPIVDISTSVAALAERLVGKAIIDIWTVEDVQQFRSDLSRQQAWRVLQSAEETFDPNLGVVGTVVVQIAQTLYPLSEDRRLEIDMAMFEKMGAAADRRDARLGLR